MPSRAQRHALHLVIVISRHEDGRKTPSLKISECIKEINPIAGA